MVPVRRLELYFKANPAHENAPQGVTTAAAGQLYKAIAAARDQLTEADADQDAKKTARDTAKESLRKTLQNLVDELDLLLAGDDPRWKRFGLEMPAERRTPAAPENVSVNTSIAGKLLVACDPVPGAGHYRFWLQEHGSAQEPAAVGTSREPQFLVENVAAGKKYNVSVSAVNGAGKESRLSAPVEATPIALAA
jgi:hypothetical protein